MRLTAQDMAQAISTQCFVDADVVASVKPAALYMLGALNEDDDTRAEIKEKLLTSLKAAQAQIPHLIKQIEAL